MAVQSKAWEQVGTTFDSLTAHLRRRFDEVGADAAADREAFEKSLRALLTSLEETLSSAGSLVRDPVLRRDLTKLAKSVRKALVETFETAGEQVRDRLPAQVRRVGASAKRPRTATRRTTAKPKATPAKPAAKKPAAKKPAAKKPAPHTTAPRKRVAR